MSGLLRAISRLRHRRSDGNQPHARTSIDIMQSVPGDPNLNLRRILHRVASRKADEPSITAPPSPPFLPSLPTTTTTVSCLHPHESTVTSSCTSFDTARSTSFDTARSMPEQSPVSSRTLGSLDIKHKASLDNNNCSSSSSSLSDDAKLAGGSMDDDHNIEDVKHIFTTDDDNNNDNNNDEDEDSADEHNFVGSHVERCTVHPGSRHTHWCGECQQVLCTHCVPHHTHTTSTLAQAYDDAFDAIEAMQVSMVRHLHQARKHTAQLGSQTRKLEASCEQAHDELDSCIQRVTASIDKQYRADRERLAAECDAFVDWRMALEDTMQTVHRMVEELPAAQLVAKRERVLALLGAVERTRPRMSISSSGSSSGNMLVDLVRPPWHTMELYVPRVQELGRRRGHVRVQSPACAAQGADWQAEARRTRGPLGDPCLSITVTRVSKAPLTEAPSFSAQVFLREPSSAEQQQRQFVHEAPLLSPQPAEFTLCSLRELHDLDILDSSGGVTVYWSVRADSFGALAATQQQRIAELEQRVRELVEERREETKHVTQSKSPSAAGSFAFSAPRSSPVLLLQPLSSHMLATPDPREEASRSPGLLGTQGSLPNAKQLQSLFAATSVSNPSGSPSIPSARPSLSSPRRNPPPPPPGPLDNSTPSQTPASRQRPRANSSTVTATPLSPAPEHANPAQSTHSHRRALSLTTKLRRQPPIPFPIAATHNAQQQQQHQLFPGSANSSQVSVSTASNAERRGGVFRRLSGWVRSTEDRVAGQARRVRRQLSAGGSQGENEDDDALDDWTFLDSVASPGFPGNERVARAKDRPQWPPPPPSSSPAVSLPPSSPSTKTASTTHPLPTVPLPPVPEPNSTAQTPTFDDIHDGFEFDGLADLEREQAKVDARHTNHQQAPGGIHARCDLLKQRMDVLDLIANTVENSRDGMTEGTLRRISSELGVLAARPSHCGNVSARAKRSVTLGASEIRAVGARCGYNVHAPKANININNNDDNEDNVQNGSRARRGSEASSVRGRSPARITQPAATAVAAATAPTTMAPAHRRQLAAAPQPGPVQLMTPQATRRGGILKPGRTQRPTRTTGELRVVTPTHGPGRFSEFTVASDTVSPRSPSSISSSSVSIIARQARSARAARKQVRFPEEQRLLESIRLIDPRTAQCIESRSASADSLPSVRDSSLDSLPSIRDSSSTDSLPYIQNMPANCTAPIHTTDAAALTHAVARGVPEPDTLSSTCDSAHAPRYARPPIPRTLHDAKVVRSKGAVIFDHAALSPTLAAMGQEYGASSADDMDQQQRDQRYRVYGGTNSSGMAVGPNPSSAQSSPAPNRVSSKCPSASPSPPSS